MRNLWPLMSEMLISGEAIINIRLITYFYRNPFNSDDILIELIMEEVIQNIGRLLHRF